MEGQEKAILTHDMTKKGFTLIEVLVAATIIAVLMAVGVVSYTTASQKSRDSKRRSDIEQIRSALEMYRADNGYYPADGTGGFTSPTSLVSNYMPAIPTDPQGSNYRYQARTVNGGNYYEYYVTGYLENMTGITNPCTPASWPTVGGKVHNYCMKNP